MFTVTRNRIRSVVRQGISSNSVKNEFVASSSNLDIENCTDERKNLENTETMDEDSASPKASNWEPRYWRQHLDNIRQMRSLKNAPVDSMGANCCADAEAPPSTKRYQILLALMLSSQTKDNVTFNAMMNLRRHGCSVENILNTSEDKIAELIYPVGFYKRKAGYVKKATALLHSHYNDDIPNTAEELCKLPGVGPKMAHLAMDLAWGETSGIGVDTHVHRICNRLGWCRTTTQTPEQTRKTVEAWLPTELWSEANVLLVGFGQQICTPVKPRCGECLNRNICLYSRESVDPMDDF